MKQARMLGNYVQHLANENNLSNSDLMRILECDEIKLQYFLKGRAYASYGQISALAKEFDVTIQQMLDGNIDIYDQTVVHCMNKFKDTEKREYILDIIDNYIDIYDSVENLL